MHKLKAAIAGLSTVVVCAGMLSLTACGTPEQKADLDAQTKVQQADLSRAGAHNIDELSSVQKSYDDLANDHSLSQQMQILIRSRQAQLRQERINMMIEDLRSQELSIGRDIEDIQQLATRVSGAEASVDALKSYDPANSTARFQTQIAMIQGDANHLTWAMPNPSTADPNGKVTLPTIFALKNEIETLNGQIQQHQAAIDAAHKLSSAKGDEAEVYLRKAEGETGDQQVDDTTKAANDHKDAAIADSRAAALSNELDRMKSSLSRATDQEASLEAAVKSLTDQMQAQQTRWASIGEQIDAQKKVEQTLIGDSSVASSDASAASPTISALATDLAAKLQDAAAVREKINSEISALVQQLTVTVSECNQLRGVWLADISQKSDDPDAVIWKQAEETLHPGYFKLQMASALEARASVAAAKARIDILLDHLIKGDEVPASEAAKHFKSLDVAAASGTIKLPGIEQLLDPQKTGVPMPKAFGDIQAPDPDQMAQTRDDVNKDFQEAVDAFDPAKLGATDTGAAADQRRNIALMGGAEANRKWAQFANLIGDPSDAQNYLQAATDLEGQMDPGFALSTASLAASATHPPTVPGTAQ